MNEQRMNETFLRGAVGPRANVVRGETGDVPIYLTLPGIDNGEGNQPEIIWETIRHRSAFPHLQ